MRVGGHAAARLAPVSEPTSAACQCAVMSKKVRLMQVKVVEGINNSCIRMATYPDQASWGCPTVQDKCLLHIKTHQLSHMQPVPVGLLDQ